MAGYESTSGTTSNVGARSGPGTSASMGSSMSQQRSAEQALENVQDTARVAAQEIQRAGRDAMEGVGEVSSNFAHAFEQSLRERPAATVGMVAALGFVLGALWKR